MSTKIAWTDESWNPIVGCSKIRAGCANCYAEKMALRLSAIERKVWDKKGRAYTTVTKHNGWNGKTVFVEYALEKPLHWKKPRKIFICSMGDLFHESVPFEWLNEIFSKVIEICPQHKFIVLTKRPERMKEYFSWRWGNGRIPSRHVYLGVSISTQKDADEMIPILLQIPAARRIVSAEPLLEYIEHTWDNTFGPDLGHMAFIDDLIIGCESGLKRRPCEIEWVRSIVEQCKALGVKVFVKQLNINGKVSHDMAEWPEDLRIRDPL